MTDPKRVERWGQPPSLHILSLAAAVAVALLVAPGCGDDDGGKVVEDVDVVADTVEADTVEADTVETDTVTPIDVSAEVQACKDQLALAEPYRALKEAEAALEKSPTDPDAHFCAALAGMIDRIEFTLSLMKVLDQAQTFVSLTAEEPSYGDELANDLHRIFGYLRAGFAEGVEHLDAIGDQPLSFDTTEVWVYNGPTPMLVYRGHFDQGDVQLMRVYGRFFVGFLDIFYGQDLRGDVGSLIALVADEGLDGGFSFAQVLNILAYLTASDDRFLQLHPEDGEAAFLEAREILGSFGPDLREALATVESLPSAGDIGDVTTAELMVDDGYRLTIHSRVDPGEDDARVETPIEVELAGPVLDGLEAVSQSVREPGTLVPWAGGMTHLLAIMIEPVIETRAFGDITLGGVTLSPGFFTIDSLANLIAALVPAPAAFDMGTFYSNPVGLRALLPRTEALGGFGHDRLVSEWECPADLVDGKPQGQSGILCSEEAELVDAAHFVGTSDEIPADGYASAFPYFAWNDPTWNGLLWADLSEVLPDTEAGYVAVGAETINIVVAEIVGPLLSLGSSN